MKPSRPIRRRKLFEEIADQIERMIVSGKYREGDHLPSEREIMEAFGVGRTSVREALFALQTMGLVRISGGERARVTRPTASRMIDELAGAARHMLARSETMKHFQQARLLFEAGLVRIAAEIRTDDDLRALEEALEENHRYLSDPVGFMESDVPFHYALSRMTGNPIFMAVHQGMAEWLAEVRAVTLRVPDTAERAYAAHQRIYEAIKAGDPDAAEKAMRDHLEQTQRIYWSVKAAEAPTASEA